MERPPPRCVFCNTTRSEHDEAAGRKGWQSAIDDEIWERRFRLYAVPAMLAFAFVAVQNDSLRSLARVFLTMWLHEFGHALAAWFTGYGAFPGPWRTWISADRVLLVTVLIVVPAGYAAYRLYVADRRWLSATSGAVAVLACIGAFATTESRARTLFTFFGDGGMMLIGTGLILTFWAKPGSHLQVSWLRWGFLFIGAFAIADGLSLWWAARTDPTVIPYGEIEGVGMSDPLKLVDVAGWSQKDMVWRFNAVGVLSLSVVAARYVLGLRALGTNADAPEGT